MNFEGLLKNKIIEKLNKKQEPDFSSAEKDLDTARDVFLSGHFDWALNIAYNAVLLSSRELMFFLGFRPIGKEHHKAVFEFLKETNFEPDLVEYFNKIRVIRNKNIYGESDDITESLADESIIKAEGFVQKIRTFVQKIRTGEKVGSLKKKARIGNPCIRSQEQTKEPNIVEKRKQGVKDE